MSLRWRINLVVLALLLAFSALLCGVAVDILRKSVKEEIEASSRVAIHLLGSLVGFNVVGGDRGPDGLIDYLRSVARIRSNESVIRRGEQEIYRSPPPSYKWDKTVPAWFSRIMDPHIPPFSFRYGEFSVTLTPDPSRAILDAWDDGQRLALALLVLMIVLGALLHWLVGRALGPVEEIVGALKRMEHGDLKTRLADLSPREFERIAQGFNAMAEALEQSRHRNLRLEENQRIAHHVQDRLEEERKALARELHDELGQGLTAIRSIATSIAHRSKDRSPDVAASGQAIVSVAGQLYDGVHSLIGRLRPAAMVGLNLVEALKGCIEQWQSLHREVEVLSDFPAELRASGEATQITLLRVLQESLTNVARHAHAHRVRIRLCQCRQALSIEVSDDGSGCDPAAAAADGRYGLLGMRERVHALGGEFRFETGRGQGMRIVAWLPDGGTGEETVEKCLCQPCV